MSLIAKEFEQWMTKVNKALPPEIVGYREGASLMSMVRAVFDALSVVCITLVTHCCLYCTGDTLSATGHV